MIRHAFNTVLTRIFVTIAMVIQSSLWTRLLAPEGRGLYAKLQASQNLLVLTLGFGITAGTVYFGSSQRARLPQLWTLAIYVSALGTILTAVVVLLGFVFPQSELIFPVGYSLPFFGFYFWFSFVQSQVQLTVSSFLSVKQNFSALNRLEILAALFRMILIVTAYFYHRSNTSTLDLEILFSLDLAAQIFKSICFWRAFRRLNLPVSIVVLDWKDVTPVFRYSGALYALAVIQFLYQRIDVWIIEHWNGLAALGIFSGALGLAQYLTLLPMALNSILVPRLSHIDETNPYGELARFSRLNASVLFLPALVLSLFPTNVLTLMFGAAFAAGGSSLRLLAAAFWLVSIKHIFVYFNASQNRLRANFIIELVGFVSGLGLNLWWVPIYGIDGASAAFLVTSALTTLLCFLSVQKFAKEPQKNLFVLTRSDLNGFIRVLRA